MTETSPVASVTDFIGDLRHADLDTKYDYSAMAGIPLPLVETRVMLGSEELPWDGESMGELEVRGPWVAASYYDDDELKDRWSEDGWFRTGDIVSMDPRGFIQIKDRSKDVIKSGGEWISSVELENKIMGHPAVAEAAVIAVPDPKWQERPMAVVVLKQGESVTEEQLKRVPERPVREVVGARPLRVHRRDPEDGGRQVPQDGAARPVRRRGRGGAGLDVRAILLRETGGPDRLELAEVPEPEPGEGQAAAARACGGDQLRRRARTPGALSAGAAAADGARERGRGRGRRAARDRAAAGRRLRRACARGRERARADPRLGQLRGGRRLPAHVPDGVDPADAAGAAGARRDRARACGLRRRRLGGDPGREASRRPRRGDGEHRGEAACRARPRRGRGARLRGFRRGGAGGRRARLGRRRRLRAQPGRAEPARLADRHRLRGRLVEARRPGPDRRPQRGHRRLLPRPAHAPPAGRSCSRRSASCCRSGRTGR